MVDTILSNRRPLGMFLASLFLLLIFMSYQVTDAGTGRTVLGNVLFRIFSPIQMFVTSSYDAVSNVFHHYVFVTHVSQENRQLKKELKELKIQLAASVHEKEENERLRKILQLQKRLPYKLLVGEVIGRDARVMLSDTLTVNRGSRDGIHKEMAVVSPQGVVGMVTHVTSQICRVQLITDGSSALGAMLEKDGTSGILAGVGRSVCLLRFLPLISDIKPGDVVVTSGQDGIFPEGMPIGIVTRLVRESEFYTSMDPHSDFYRTAEVRPYENFSSLKEVVFLLTTTLDKGQKQTSDPEPSTAG